MKETTQHIPPQREGIQADIIEMVKAADAQDAKLIFLQARERLYAINNWSGISEGITANFALTDSNGNQKDDRPLPGDMIRIDIPGPGSSAGEGYDWVRVELVEDNRHPDRDEEWSVMKVRPAEDPVKQEGVAHFLENIATSSFIVRRHDDLVSAEVHGRNEKPNTGAKKIGDKIRNLFVGSAAAAGVGKIQWQKLVRGILNRK